MAAARPSGAGSEGESEDGSIHRPGLQAVPPREDQALPQGRQVRLAEVPDRDPALPAGRARPEPARRTATTCCRSGRSRRPAASTASWRSSSTATTRRPPASTAGPARRCSRSWRAAWTTWSTAPGFAKSRDMARQLVGHGHFLVNGQQGGHPLLPGQRERHRRGRGQVPRADPVRSSRGPRPASAPSRRGLRSIPTRCASWCTSSRSGPRSTPRSRNSSSSSTTRSKLMAGPVPGGFAGALSQLPADHRPRANERHIAGARGKENPMLIAQRPSLGEEQVGDYRSRFIDRAARAGLRLHDRQLAPAHPAVLHPGRGGHQHPDRGRAARVHHRARG